MATDRKSLQNPMARSGCFRKVSIVAISSKKLGSWNAATLFDASSSCVTSCVPERPDPRTKRRFFCRSDRYSWASRCSDEDILQDRSPQRCPHDIKTLCRTGKATLRATLRSRHWTPANNISCCIFKKLFGWHTDVFPENDRNGGIEKCLLEKEDDIGAAWSWLLSLSSNKMT